MSRTRHLSNRKLVSEYCLQLFVLCIHEHIFLLTEHNLKTLNNLQLLVHGLVGLKNVALAAKSLQTAVLQECRTHSNTAVYITFLFTYKYTNCLRIFLLQ